MPGHDIIVIGASAGGVEALTKLVRQLPEDLPAAIFVVLHVPAHVTSALPLILNRNGPLVARHPADGEVFKPGMIYVAPPGTHLLLGLERIRLSRGPRDNGHRPAVDPLFRTAALSHGRRVVGVILSGALDDGTAGLQDVKRRGGVTVVQDPDDALYAGMPRSAIESVVVDYCLPVAEIAETLTRLALDPVPEEGNEIVPGSMRFEAEMAAFDREAIEIDANHRPGSPSPFACPDCAGVLWEDEEEGLPRFRCRVGHAWTPLSLLAQQSDNVETALWTALRALEERAALSERLVEKLRQRGNSRSAGRFEAQAREARHRAAILRQVLVSEPASEVETIPSELDQHEGPVPNG